MSAINSIFSNSEKMRLPSDHPSFAGAKEIVCSVPVRKPNRHEYVCVHPDPEMSLTWAVFVGKED